MDLSKKPNVVGQFIRLRREAAGLSQKSLGQQFAPPVTTQFISNVERGITPLPSAHFGCVKRALTVGDEELKLLLEKEYQARLEEKLPNQDKSARSAMSQTPMAAGKFFDSLKTAYESSDTRTQALFRQLCEGLFKIQSN